MLLLQVMIVLRFDLMSNVLQVCCNENPDVFFFVSEEGISFFFFTLH